jgi:hypothetical protein
MEELVYYGGVMISSTPLICIDASESRYSHNGTTVRSGHK